ncbi:MAG: hypothetical protein IPK35_07120 [Saprospiraceae bacterium]|nr:hypothetical protein [Saprospiraceae bacterium]
MPSLKNDGVLNLDHSEIKSTNDPVIQNNGQLNIIGNKISLIKTFDWTLRCCKEW